MPVGVPNGDGRFHALIHHVQTAKSSGLNSTHLHRHILKAVLAKSGGLRSCLFSLDNLHAQTNWSGKGRLS